MFTHFKVGPIDALIRVQIKSLILGVFFKRNHDMLYYCINTYLVLMCCPSCKKET